MNAPVDLAGRVRAASRVTYARSGGPGGQNVNKVSSKVVVRLRLDAPGVLSPEDLPRARERLARRLTTRGELVVVAQDTRDQGRNREIAVQRLVALVAGALRRRKRRRKTEPTAGSREARLASKRRRAQVKSLRRAAPEE